MDTPREPESVGERAGEEADDEELRALRRLLGGAGPGGALDTRAGNGQPRERRLPRAGTESPENGDGRALAARFEPEGPAASHPFGESGLAHDRAQAGRAVRLLRLSREHSARPGLAERLEEQALRLASLPTDGFVVPRTLARAADGRLELASEAPTGESVHSLLERRGTLPPRHALEITRQTLELLELAHGRGHPHGALSSRTVWLASRTPWDAHNPFGVHVRLIDHGLAAVLAPASSSVPGDLEALGALLVEMLTGTGGELPRADWPALRAALPTRDLRALLERVLGAGPSFPSAGEFRAALERTSSWRGDGPGRRLVPLAALSAALALLVLLGLWRRERSALAAERARAESELAAARSEAWLPAAAGALDRFLERLEEGQLSAAAEVLAAARSQPELARLGFDAGWLELTLEARAALDEAGRAGDELARARALLAARAALARARGAREAFRLAGARWLGLERAPRPGRAADSERWHESLERELAQRSAALEGALASRWESLRGDGSDDPEELRLLATWYGDERVRAFAERLPQDAAPLAAELRALAQAPGLVPPAPDGR